MDRPRQPILNPMAHPNTRITNFTNRTITVTPVLDTNAYAAGDVLFAATELDFGNALVSGVIKHASILDTDDQASQTITLYFAGSTLVQDFMVQQLRFV